MASLQMLCFGWIPLPSSMEEPETAHDFMGTCHEAQGVQGGSLQLTFKIQPLIHFKYKIQIKYKTMKSPSSPS